MTNRTRTAFSIVLALPAIVFVLTGLRWWVDPTAAADQLGMPLLSGLGLSSQVGDLAAFFLMMGLFVLAGIATRTRHWFYAPVTLLLLAALSRVLAWALHDATLAFGLIAPELVTAALLWFASRRVCAQ